MQCAHTTRFQPFYTSTRKETAPGEVLNWSLPWEAQKISIEPWLTHGNIIFWHVDGASKCTHEQSSGVQGHSVLHATRHILEAQCAFKILMIHEVLQFALRIAFRCVLHRCGSHDIRCWKLYTLSINLEEGEWSGCPSHSTPDSFKFRFLVVLLYGSGNQSILVHTEVQPWHTNHLCVCFVCMLFGHKILIETHASLVTGGQGSGRDTCCFTGREILDRCGNDPSAGSPTETLLRLHLPLNDKV